MAENEEESIERDEEFEEQPIGASEEMDDVIPVSGMYKNWFLDMHLMSF